jgi:phosphatidylinositol alpha-1,6-mannosyltransferase
MGNELGARRLLCGFDSLDGSQGGIARVGRLVYRVICDPRAGLVPADVVVYRDRQRAIEGGVRVACARESRLRYSLAVNRAALDHAHFFYGFLGMARAHGGLPQLLRRPYACFIHGIEAWPGPWARSDRIHVARRASLLVANSEYTVRRAARLDPTFARSKVCWLSTEEDVPPSSSPIDDGPPRILIIGRLDEGLKGHQELIRCWPRVVAAVPDAILTVVGKGPRRDEFQKLAGDSGVGTAIEFRGFVREADVSELWRRTVAFAMPGRVEGFGLTYVEAMRHGIPVIASIHDAGAEINVDGVTGYNIDMDDPNELPDRLIQLLKDRDHAVALGANGKSRWAEHFRFSAFRERFSPILREFLDT